jgi:hypothetical protein
VVRGPQFGKRSSRRFLCECRTDLLRLGVVVVVVVVVVVALVVVVVVVVVVVRLVDY